MRRQSSAVRLCLKPQIQHPKQSVFCYSCVCFTAFISTIPVCTILSLQLDSLTCASFIINLVTEPFCRVDYEPAQVGPSLDLSSSTVSSIFQLHLISPHYRKTTDLPPVCKCVKLMILRPVVTLIIHIVNSLTRRW